MSRQDVSKIKELVDLLVEQGVLPAEHKRAAIKEVDKWLHRFLDEH